MKKIQKYIVSVYLTLWSYGAIAALNLEKADDYMKSVGFTGDVSNDGGQIVVLILNFVKWAFILGPLVMGGFYIIKAGKDASNNEKGQSLIGAVAMWLIVTLICWMIAYALSLVAGNL